MITVTFRGKRIAFTDAATYDYIRGGQGTFSPPAWDALTLYDVEGNRIATFYDWDTVDAGEQP